MAAIFDVLGGICLVAGAFFALTGGIGIVRLPDFYTRMHGSALTDTLGAWLVLLGLMFTAGLTLVTVKLIMIGLLLALTSPTATHALARSAWEHGRRPWLAPEEGEDVPTDG